MVLGRRAVLGRRRGPPIRSGHRYARGVPGSSGRRAARVTAIVLAALLVVSLVVVVGGAVLLARRPLPSYDGQIRLDGLRAEVEVVRDDRGVPQIYADDARDLFRAQGYVHAQDRFFEMDYRRRMASGRLSELLGPSDGVLESDAVVRTLGWRQVAEEEFALLSASSASHLAAYAEGVNDYLAGREASRLALEYSALDLTGDVPEIERWTEVDSLVWLKAFAWDLAAGQESELERSALYEVLEDVGQVDELFPSYPQDRHDPIVGDGRVVAEVAGVSSSPAADALVGEAGFAALAGSRASLDALETLGGSSAVGSNSWVVAGNLTAGGAPILAVDPHLAATLPGVWYQSGLHCRELSPSCPFDVAGLGLAGLPGILIGHNAELAWALTSMHADVTDLFLERVFDDGTYLRDGGRVPLERRTEVIAVNGGEDVRVEVSETAHGPLVSDVIPALRSAGEAPVPAGSPEVGLRGYSVAVASSVLEPSRTLDGILALGTASGPSDVTSAAALIGAPAFNVVYATTGGDIGYQAAGQVPQRGRVFGAPVSSDGTWPRPGWDSTYDWFGFVSSDDLPGELNPAAGYIVAANQAVQPSGEGPALGAEWDAGYRANRIASAIVDAAAEGTPLTVELTGSLQNDAASPIADILVPHLLRVEVEDSFVAEGVDLLREWDRRQSADSAAAVYFASVWANLLRLTFWDDVPEGYEPDGDSRWFEVVRQLLDQPQSAWWDDRSTINVVESRDQVLIEALTSARLQLTVSMGKDPAQWAWSKAHLVRLANPVLGSDRFGSVVRTLVNPGPVSVGGGPGHVNANAWDARAWDEEYPDFDVVWAPEARLVVDLGDFDSSTWVAMTGISGHPASGHYTDQLRAWAAGESFAWPFTEEAVREAAAATQLLLPPDG